MYGNVSFAYFTFDCKIYITCTICFDVHRSDLVIEITKLF